MLDIEKTNRQLLRLIDSLRLRIGAYNLYSNIVYLLFLKYIVSYADQLDLSNIESYKAVSAFKRKYDSARVGAEPLRPEDIYEVLRALDEDPKLGSIHFVDSFRNYSEIFSDTEIQRDVLRALDDFDIQCDKEYLGNFFELLIYRCIGDVRKTGLSMTNKSLRQLTAMLLNVNDKDRYLDCYCGFSSTLFDIENYGSYIGYEINPETALVSKMNLIMLGKKNYEIIASDFLEEDTHEIADKVFSDGPISMYGNKEHLCLKFGVQTKDLDLLSLYKVLDSTKIGGTAVITVPAKVLFSNSKGYQELRKRFIEEGLKAVISLPPLWAGVAVNTNLLVVEKGYKGNIEFIEAKNLGVSDRRNVSLPIDVIQKIAISVREKVDVQGFSKSEDWRNVMCNGTWLPSKYIEQVVVNNYRSVEKIDDELTDLYAELKKNL